MAKLKTYSIANDTLNGLLDTDALHNQLKSDPTIGDVYDGINRDQGSGSFDVHLVIERTAATDTAMDAVIAAHDGVAIADIQVFEYANKSAIQDATPVMIFKPEKEGFARATHDYCDRTTWFSQSIRVTGEAPSNVNLVYTLANQNVIDVINKKINRQDTLQEYRVVVYDGGTEISEYTIDHAAGTITLNSTPSGTITVDYSYENGSEWIIEPKPGRILIIEHSEVQFATDVQMSTPLRFEIWVYNPFFNPGATIDPDDPAWFPGHPTININPLRFQYQNVQYNGMRDLVNEANLGAGTIPAIDDLPECSVFPFNYASIKALKSSEGAQIRVKAVGDEPITGSFGTATFYCLTMDEQ